MCQDKRIESHRFAERPWLFISLLVDTIAIKDGDRVHHSDIDRHGWAQSVVVEIWVDVERACKSKVRH